jgi:hypothetical protein
MFAVAKQKSQIHKRIAQNPEMYQIGSVNFFGVNYFILADLKNLLKELDEWTRSRIRTVTWKRWKKVRTRFENLKQAGLEEEKAWLWTNKRLGY